MITTSTVSRILRGFSNTRVMVLGDLIADEFLNGEVTRISREAPVLILRHRSTDVVPGGAANAAANMASLGGRVEVVGVFGQDVSGETLAQSLIERGVDTSGVVIDPDRPTTTKTRISASSQQSVNQQIVRVDRESHEPLSPELEDAVIAVLEERIPEIDGLLISDYGNGVLTPRIVAKALDLVRQHGKLVTVDAQGDLSVFKGVAALTPNQPEAEAVVGFPIVDQDSLKRAGQRLLELTEARSVLITRGGNGIAVFENGGEVTQIPAFNRTEVFDVTGAGDTVVGTLTLALAGGASYVEATILANLAASIVVRRFGTSTTTVDEMERTFAAMPDEVFQR
ncbi:Bifunctional protein HldE [compost metagenome]